MKLFVVLVCTFSSLVLLSFASDEGLQVRPYTQAEMDDIKFEQEYEKNYSVAKAAATRLMAAVKLACIYIKDGENDPKELLQLLYDPRAAVDKALLTGDVDRLQLCWDIGLLDQSIVDLREKDLNYGVIHILKFLLEHDMKLHGFMDFLFKEVRYGTFHERDFDAFVRSGLPFDQHLDSHNMLFHVARSSKIRKLQISHELYKRGLRISSFDVVYNSDGLKEVAKYIDEKEKERKVSMLLCTIKEGGFGFRVLPVEIFCHIVGTMRSFEHSYLEDNILSRPFRSEFDLIADNIEINPAYSQTYLE